MTDSCSLFLVTAFFYDYAQEFILHDDIYIKTKSKRPKNCQSFAIIFVFV